MFKQNPKTAPYKLKAKAAYDKRKKAAGFVSYTRLIKPEWKEILDTLLKTLKEK